MFRCEKGKPDLLAGISGDAVHAFVLVILNIFHNTLDKLKFLLYNYNQKEAIL